MVFMRTIKRPHGKLSDGSGLHEDLKETIWKDCFIAVGLHRDHQKTILKDCFIANGLHKDLKKTINDLQVSGALCPFCFLFPKIASESVKDFPLDNL